MQNATDKNSELMMNTETASVQFFVFEVGLMAESLYVKLTQALGAFYSIFKGRGRHNTYCEEKLASAHPGHQVLCSNECKKTFSTKWAYQYFIVSEVITSFVLTKRGLAHQDALPKHRQEHRTHHQ